jgi:hypothetical protein
MSPHINSTPYQRNIQFFTLTGYKFLIRLRFGSPQMMIDMSTKNLTAQNTVTLQRDHNMQKKRRIRSARNPKQYIIRKTEKTLPPHKTRYSFFKFQLHIPKIKKTGPTSCQARFLKKA